MRRGELEEMEFPNSKQPGEGVLRKNPNRVGGVEDMEFPGVSKK